MSYKQIKIYIEKQANKFQPKGSCKYSKTDGEYRDHCDPASFKKTLIKKYTECCRIL